MTFRTTNNNNKMEEAAAGQEAAVWQKQPGPSKKIKPWGSTRKDLPTVFIEMTMDNVIGFVEFTSVSFKVNEVKQKMTVSYKPPDFNQEEAKEVFSRSLLAQINPLAGLTIIAGKLPKRKKYWQIASTNIPDRGLGKDLILAFLYRMVDTEAKFAMSELLKSIIKEKGLDYLVTSTCSATKATRFAGVIKVSTSLKSSDEGTDFESDYNAPIAQKAVETPVVKKVRFEDRYDEVSTTVCSCPSGSQMTKSKLVTPDICVYKQDDIFKPVTAQLIVSVKSGFYHEIRSEQLLKQMMSRLPFQDSVWGVEINACMASFYKIMKTEDFVYITKGKEFHFYTDSNQFDTSNFISFMKYLGQILAVQIW